MTEANRIYKQRCVQAMFPTGQRVLFEQAIADYEEISEIRIRRCMPVQVIKGNKVLYIEKGGAYVTYPQHGVVFTNQQFEELFAHICRHSVYAFEQELKNGYLTLEGGHRMGVVGQTVWEGNELKSIKYFQALNLRIAHEVKGCGDKILPFIIDKDEVRSTLLVSLPGCGKTTLLRDLIRKISNGSRESKPKKVCIIDERSELASCYLGVPQNDVGMHTDVLDACPKARGILMVLRSMSPQVIAVDELGGDEDYEALQQAFYLGCKILATVHGNSYENLCKNHALRSLMGQGGFQRIVFLGGVKIPGEILLICNEKGEIVGP